MAEPTAAAVAEPGASASNIWISVELVIQCLEARDDSRKRYQLFRSVHRVPAGTTIRQLIEMAYPESQSSGSSADAHDPADAGVPVDAGQSEREGNSSGAADGRVQAGRLIADIETKARGLSRHGRRAWLDDLLIDADRVEVMLPILADARKARFERVAKNRARKWRMS